MQKEEFKFLEKQWKVKRDEQEHLQESFALLTEYLESDDDKNASLLIVRGLSPNIVYNGLTPLILAAKLGALKSFEKFMRLGADVGGCDEVGKTALFYALETHREDILGLILRYYETKSSRLKKLKRLKDESTPLIHATKYSFYEGVKALLEYGALVDERDLYNRTALWYCLSKAEPNEDDNRIARLLLDSNANPDQRDVNGNSPQDVAANPVAQAELEGAKMRAAMPLVLNEKKPEPEPAAEEASPLIIQRRKPRPRL